MNRKYKVQRVLAVILTFVFILAFPAVAFATDINVTADSTSVKVGDTVSLTVIISAEHIAVANGVFTYDPALLSYISSDGGASDGYINIVSAQKGGSSSLTAVIKFVAKSEGDAIINVSMDNVLSYGEQKLENVETGVSITVAPSGAAPTVSDGEIVPVVNLSQTGVAAGNVTGATAQMYVWRSLSSLTLPSGFADKQVTYGGEYVNGAAIPDSEDLILLYLSEAAGENAGYYIYNAEKNTLVPYITITSVLANFTIMWPDESVVAPDGYKETAFKWKEKDVPAWQVPSETSVYLVYARNSSGEKGFYLFNIEDESVQRFKALTESGPEVTAAPKTAPVSVQVNEDKPNSGITIDNTLFIALCAAGALMLAAIVVLVVLYVKKSSHSKYKYAHREEKNKTAS